MRHLSAGEFILTIELDGAKTNPVSKSLRDLVISKLMIKQVRRVSFAIRASMSTPFTTKTCRGDKR